MLEAGNVRDMLNLPHQTILPEGQGGELVTSRHKHDGARMHSLESLLTVVPNWTIRAKCNAEFGQSRLSSAISIDSICTSFLIITSDYISFHRSQCDAA